MSWLHGRKTYILAGLGIATAVIAIATDLVSGDYAGAVENWKLLLASGAVATFRHAMSTGE